MKPADQKEYEALTSLEERAKWLLRKGVTAKVTIHPERLDLTVKDSPLQPTDDGRVRCSAWLGDVRSAKAIIRDMLKMLPIPACELFHHSRKDRHTWGEPCPCVKRYEARLKAAKDFLSSPNALDQTPPPTA